MSRFGDDYDDDEAFPNEAELWRANALRALKGKRGRRVLSDLREALLALPEKRLIASAMCTVAPDTRRQSIGDDAYGIEEFNEIVTANGEGVCAIGAYLWYRKVKDGADPVEAFDSLPLIYGDNSPSGGIHDTATSAKREAGVVFSLAWNLAYRNDETYGNLTPEQRYTAFLEWIDSELSVTSVAS